VDVTYLLTYRENDTKRLYLPTTDRQQWQRAEKEHHSDTVTMLSVAYHRRLGTVPPLKPTNDHTVINVTLIHQ